MTLSMNRSSKKRLLLVFVLIGVFALAHYFGLGKWLTLESLQSNVGALKEQIAVNPLISYAAYFLFYIFIVALSLPGATVMTLAAGALFGFWHALVLVSFASTIGASLAFLVSRFLLRDWVANRFRERVNAINKGLEQDGALYLFSLRLIPLFPFFVINLVMGLTTMSLATFFWVSQLGMLPGTAVYVNAGTQLSQVQAIGDVMSLELLASFALIGILPLCSRWILDYVKAQAVFNPYVKPKKFDYNIVVIGAGAGGLVTSYIAAALKAKVVLIEKHRMGGDCLYTGCVPSKALIRSASVLQYAKRAQEFGFDSIRVEHDFANVMERVQRVIKEIEPHDSVERYTKLGVECIAGEAKIVSPFEVEVNGRTLTTKTIVVATGASPFVPPIDGLDSVEYYTSDTIWNLRALPERMVVLGGGPIGCELAQSFNRLGANVTQIETAECVLNREDKEVSDFICERLMQEGVKVLSGHRAERVEVEGDSKYLVCSTESGKERVGFDCLLLAVGRKANVTGFGLEELGISLTEKGTIKADKFLRTNFPNIYVAGDVAGPYQFTHFASHQAWYASVNALLSPFKRFKTDYRVIPWCTFTDPEVAHVGLNEREAKEQEIEYEVTKYGIDDLDRAIADSEAHGFVKVITPKGSDKILGVTIVAYHAGDLLAEYVLAMKHGLGLNKILGTIHSYPTMSEANKYAAGVWKKAHAPETLLSWVARFHTWRRGGA